MRDHKKKKERDIEQYMHVFKQTQKRILGHQLFDTRTKSVGEGIR